MNPLACASAVRKIKEKLSGASIETSSTSVDSDSDSSENVNIWNTYPKLVYRNWKAHDEVAEELFVYIKSPVGRLNEDPLEVWANLKHQFPKLYHIAYKYLTIVGTSVPSERLFSKAGQLLTQQRNRQKGKKLMKLLFLQSLDNSFWDL